MKKIRLTTWSQRILKDQEGLWAKVTLEICNEQTVQARGTRERCEAGKEKNPSQALLLQLTFLLPGHIMSLSEKIQRPQVTALFPSQLKKKKKKSLTLKQQTSSNLAQSQSCYCCSTLVSPGCISLLFAMSLTHYCEASNSPRVLSATLYVNCQPLVSTVF